ncbi:TorF family putative porin [Aliikangiella sp. IMCC44359]|uniref:TorF family putative porin n=1 Tax=Aliikangiella sp. IMCC44359 TaxID=3459125 RepID=UPI00403A976F
MKFKQPILAATLLLAATSLTTQAKEFETSASATLVSQYIFRGFDLNQEDPALQGDFTVEHSSGFMFSVWGTNYDVGVDDGVEIDLVGGYSFNLNKDVTLSLGFTEYTYSGDTDSSTEFNIGASIKNFTMTYYSDQDLDVDYLELGYEMPLSPKSSLDFHVGRNSPDNGEDNNDFAVSYSYQINRAKLFATYSKNDLDVEGAEDYIFAGATYSF